MGQIAHGPLSLACCYCLRSQLTDWRAGWLSRSLCLSLSVLPAGCWNPLNNAFARPSATVAAACLLLMMMMRPLMNESFQFWNFLKRICQKASEGSEQSECVRATAQGHQTLCKTNEINVRCLSLLFLWLQTYTISLCLCLYLSLSLSLSITSTLILYNICFCWPCSGSACERRLWCLCSSLS